MVNTRKRKYKDSKEKILDKLVEITELSNILLEDLERNQPQINTLFNKQQKLIHQLSQVQNDTNQLTSEEIKILEDALKSENENDFHTPNQSDSDNTIKSVGKKYDFGKTIPTSERSIKKLQTLSKKNTKEGGRTSTSSSKKTKKTKNTNSSYSNNLSLILNKLRNNQKILNKIKDQKNKYYQTYQSYNDIVNKLNSFNSNYSQQANKEKRILNNKRNTKLRQLSYIASYLKNESFHLENSIKDNMKHTKQIIQDITFQNKKGGTPSKSSKKTNKKTNKNTKKNTKKTSKNTKKTTSTKDYTFFESTQNGYEDFLDKLNSKDLNEGDTITYITNNQLGVKVYKVINGTPIISYDASSDMVGGKNIFSKLFNFNKSKQEECEKKAKEDCDVLEIQNNMIKEVKENNKKIKDRLDRIKKTGKYDTITQKDPEARNLQAYYDFKDKFKAYHEITDKELGDSLREPAIEKSIKCEEEKIEQCMKNKKK